MLDMYKYSVTLKAYILKTARHVPYIWVADGQRGGLRLNPKRYTKMYKHILMYSSDLKVEQCVLH